MDLMVSVDEKQFHKGEVKRILMVDDNPIDHFIHRQLFEQHQCEVHITTVETVKQAIHELAHQSFDLIVTDLSLSGETGLDLVDHLTKANASTPVVVLSSSRLPFDIERAFYFPNVMAYLVKPLTDEGIRLLLQGNA